MGYIGITNVTIDKPAFQKLIIGDIGIFKIAVIKGAFEVFSFGKYVFGKVVSGKGFRVYVLQIHMATIQKSGIIKNKSHIISVRLI